MQGVTRHDYRSDTVGISGSRSLARETGGESWHAGCDQRGEALGVAS